jgi:hypothetical protein
MVLLDEKGETIWRSPMKRPNWNHSKRIIRRCQPVRTINGVSDCDIFLPLQGGMSNETSAASDSIIPSNKQFIMQRFVKFLWTHSKKIVTLRHVCHNNSKE